MKRLPAVVIALALTLCSCSPRIRVAKERFSVTSTDRGELLTGEDIASLKRPNYGFLRLALEIGLTDEASARFAEYTTAYVGETLIVRCGQSTVVPIMILDPITNGLIRIIANSATTRDAMYFDILGTSR